jgi:hypothetical protein
MKKSLLLLSAIAAFSAPALAQSKLVLTKAEVETAPNAWTTANENAFTYVGVGILSTDTWQEATATDPALHNVRRYSYTNNANGKPATVTFENWNTATNAWVPSNRRTCVYNTAGELGNVAISEWNAADNYWNPTVEDSSFAYTNGKLMTMTARYRSALTLVNSSKVAYTYLTNGKVQKTEHSLWNSNTGAWMPVDIRVSYTYDAAGRVVQKVQDNYDYQAMVWYVASEDNYTYNAMGQKTLYLQRVAEPNIPIYNFYKEVFTAHNANLQPTSSNTFIYDTGMNTWGAFLRNTYTYQSFVSTEDLAVNTNIAMMFPNPAAERVTVRLNEHPDQPTRIQIYNAIGVLVQTNNLKQQETTLSIHDLSSGMYVARIIQGNSFQTLKLQVVR